MIPDSRKGGPGASNNNKASMTAFLGVRSNSQVRLSDSQSIEATRSRRPNDGVVCRIV